ncbi:AAA family ATPase [Streptomyces sp. NPDC048254]|uniref:AAA family ATPase n=1 Tax=Streptomyces sp. NPDC048254 TaxID=3365525 RepID=UPI003710C12A
MSTQFRINAVTLATTEGEVNYRFPSDLTVLAGPTGVGKTTLLELIKFGFGGDARLATVAQEHVNDVILDVTIGDQRLRIARSLDSTKRKKARVTDLTAQERLPDHHIGTAQPSLNTLLLSALGLPDDMKAAASGQSTKAGSRITFNDVFSVLYLPQYEINIDIANSRQSYLEPKRKTVFELMFGLTDSSILDMRSQVNLLKGKIATATEQYNAVLQFLRDSSTTQRIEAEAAFERAIVTEHEAESERTALRDEIDPVVDRHTQVMRDLLTEAERSLADTRATVKELQRQKNECAQERRRVQSDLDRLNRMRDAGERLANIEFLVCPRCMQSLSGREVPADTCRVCLQPDPVEASGEEDQYELRQLTQQLEEMDDQLDSLILGISEANDAAEGRENLVQKLTEELDSRTVDRVTPRLQAYSDATERLATARAQQEQLEGVLRQWDRVNDLENAVQELRTQQERLQARIDQATLALTLRRNEILDEISEEFQAAATTLRIPGVQTAAIHRTNYLPVLNGKIFSDLMPPGGGMMTATQLAYWTSLLAVALRNPDTPYPAFLLIDTPRLALNTPNDELAAALYRRLVTLADANQRKVQFIVADNNLPAEYRSHYSEIDFDYDSPTVSTIHHPGLLNVKTIDKPAEPS